MIKTPTNQKRLTNVALIRLKRGGKRFELACYPNKVLNWRENIETDLGEVLQLETIFMDVSKGIAAKKDDLKKAFDTDDEKKIIKMILKKGELQVSEKERQHMKETLLKDIASIVASKCVDKETQRPLTPGLVEKAMKSLHFNPNTSKSAKKQSLEVIKLIQEKMPNIVRASMRVKVICKNSKKEESLKLLQPVMIQLEKELLLEETKAEDEDAGAGADVALIILIEPGQYRTVDEIVRKKCNAVLEILDTAVAEKSEKKLE